MGKEKAKPNSGYVVYDDRDDNNGRDIVNGIYPSIAHNNHVICYPNHPVYDLDKGHDPLVHVGDNVCPNKVTYG